MISLEQLYRLPLNGVVSTRPMTQGEITAAGGLQLYGPDGRLLDPNAFRSPGIDAGPGTPLLPRLPSTQAPREFQYPIAFNLIPSPRGEDSKRLQSFAMLRMFALGFPKLRTAIHYRKTQLAGLEWEPVVMEDPKSRIARKEHQPDLDRVAEFFKMPNAFDGVPFATWIKQAAEEVLVTDALCFYRLSNRGGDLHSLVQIDGTTIKPNIDEFGHIVGFQQILYGYPVTGYSAWSEEQRAAGEMRDFSPGDLVYLVHNPKVDSVYGTPPVEEILSIVQLGMARTSYQLTWYTDGTMPDGVIEAPESWSTPKQLADGQAYLDDLLNGNDRQRHKWRFVPFGSKTTQMTKGFNFNKDEDEAETSLVCAYTGVPRSLYVSTVNRATGEMQRDEAQDTGFKPFVKFFGDFFTYIVIQKFLGIEGIAMQPVYAPAGNEKEMAEAFALYVGQGILTANEVRAQKGLEPLEEPKPAPAAAPPVPGKKPAPSAPSPNVGQEGASPDGVDQEKAVLSELGEWKRFALKRVEKSRHTEPFETKALDDSLRNYVEDGLTKAATIDDVRTVFEKANGKAAKRRQYEKALKDAVARSLGHQKESLMRHAKGKLQEAAA